ncbi:MAG: LptF/LptG family permease [Candidatus Eisenbacteria bacterium]
MGILRSYILRLHLVPFLLGLSVVTFILEMDALIQYMDLIVTRGVPIGVVAQIFLLSAGFVLAMSLPCAVLVAVLMTFGRLSQDNEITAMRAGGVNLAGVVAAPLAASVVVAGLLTLFNNHVLPNANHAFVNLMVDIGRMRPTVKLQEGVFITDFPGYTMLVQSVNGRTNEMRGVTIYQSRGSGQPATIFANRGVLFYTPDGRTAVLELKDGEVHEIPPDEDGAKRYRRLVFKTHTINIPGAGAFLERSARQVRTDRELGAAELQQVRDSVGNQYAIAVDRHRERLRLLGAGPAELEALTPEQAPWTRRLAGWFAVVVLKRDPFAGVSPGSPVLRSEFDLWKLERDALRKRLAGLSVEIHKKYSLPAACVVFVLLGAPLGMRVRRTGPAVAFASVPFFLFYYLCLVGGEELADRLLFPPWLSMWLPNLVLGTWGIVATWRACELPWPFARRPRAAA